MGPNSVDEIRKNAKLSVTDVQIAGALAKKLAWSGIQWSIARLPRRVLMISSR